MANAKTSLSHEVLMLIGPKGGLKHIGFLKKYFTFTRSSFVRSKSDSGMMFNYELLEMGIVLREGVNTICKDMIEKAGNWIYAELLLYNVL